MVDIIINACVISLLYCPSVARCFCASSPTKISSECRFPTERYNDKKSGHNMSQGDSFTSIANAPAIALTTKFIAIASMSRKISFLKINE